MADFDGDGVPDFGLSSSTNYYVYALKCAGQPKPADCKGTDPGVLWQKATHDVSSGGTASSVFDFNGDGKAEVVYRDECWLRVYNGPDGKTLVAANVTSGTALELPIIADVDNDGHADIVLGSDNIQQSGNCPTSAEVETLTPWTGYTSGLMVFKDPDDRWMPSRPLWNQSTYHITNINDDLSVPTTEVDNFRSFNNYRQNVQGNFGNTLAAPDLTARASDARPNNQSDCVSVWTVYANMCNRGALRVPTGMPGTFYTDDPRKPNPTSICTARTSKALLPGECDVVHCNWQNPPQGQVPLWFRANDDGSPSKPASECFQKNGLMNTVAACTN